MRRIAAILLFAVIGMVGCDTATKEDGASEEIAVEELTPEMVRLDSLSQLLKQSPNDPKLLNERAKVFLTVNEVNFALADVGRALLIDSTVASFYLTISDVYFRLNKMEQSKNALLTAHRLQPGYSEALIRLAEFELYLQNYQKSINYANDMLRIDARDDRPFMVKGLCFKELGDTAKAVQNFLEAVTENPDNYDAYMELGILHWGKKDPLAEQYIKSALDIRPNDLNALYALGMQYQNSDKLNEALETYTQILAIDSTYKTAYFNMGYVQYEYLHLYDEALVNFNRAVKVDPKYFQAVYMRGLCYEAKGDVARAKSEYAYSLELNPNYNKAAEGMTRLLRIMPK
ncbi:MAG: tetratricopeptide repeat protein [Flavobacteriales bacterium]|nr:tetratricopeptide repeat protein [Flavobacteriales bacterium]